MRGTATRNPDLWWSTLSLPAVLIIPAMLLVQSARGDNTTCVSDQLSWYTSVVGESPCMTYQRLRQICNNKYQAPIFSSTVPGDRCDDVGESGCCCNTIAFQLSMLCLNCQQDTHDGGAGIDAPENGYSVYTDSCSPIFNHTLPDDIQSTVCNENIRLDDFLYAGWDDGSWFYLFTQENAESAHAAESNNTFTHCADQVSSSLAPTTPTTSRTVHTIAPATSRVFSTAPPMPGTATAIARTSGLSSTSTPLSNTTTPVQPSTTTTNTNVPGAGHARSKPNARAPLIGGVVAGGAVALAIVLAVTVAAIRRRRRRRARGRGLQQIRDSSDRLNLSRESSPPPPASVGHGPLLPAASRRSGTDGNSLAPPALATHSNQTTSTSTSTSTVPGIREIGMAGTPHWQLTLTRTGTGTGTGTAAPTLPLPSAGLRVDAPLSLRHDDGGPAAIILPALARSSSGRLPPAYDESWDGGGGGGTRAGGQRQRQRQRTRTGRRGTGPLTTTNGLAAGAAAAAMDSEVHEPPSESIARVRVGGRVRLLPGAKDG